MHPNPTETFLAILIDRAHRAQVRPSDDARPPARHPLPLPSLRRSIGAALVRSGDRLQGAAVDVGAPTAPIR